jgi:hypothetical protein
MISRSAHRVTSVTREAALLPSSGVYSDRCGREASAYKHFRKMLAGVKHPAFQDRARNADDLARFNDRPLVIVKVRGRRALRVATLPD